MTKNTDEAWEEWAIQDPYYSVLTDPKFRKKALTPQALEEFFASGEVHVKQVMDICRQRLNPDFAPQRVLDFGCGVGRLLIPFCAIAKEVVGTDISSTMLAKARSNCDERFLSNISLLQSDDTLSAVKGQFDLVHTAIVLQHVEIARGRQLFLELIRRIRPGGCGAIHITFAWDAHAENYGQLPQPLPPARDDSLLAAAKTLARQLIKPLRRTLAAPPAQPPGLDPEMQMNFYNLSELFFILHQVGVGRVHTEITDHGGALGSFLYFRIPSSVG
jgi:SAM-dependent methyltransferase